MAQPSMPMLPMVPGQRGKKPKVTARHRQMAARLTAKPNAKAPLGQGGRFAALEDKLASRTGKEKVSNPGALAAYIGRRKYGAERFAKMSAAGRK